MNFPSVLFGIGIGVVLSLSALVLYYLTETKGWDHEPTVDELKEKISENEEEGWFA